jgi:N-acetylmuramoyl-L-alanine amidase
MMKKHWLPLRSILLAIGFCCLVIGMAVKGIHRVELVELVSAAQPVSRPVVILDPGHGGIDGGAQANGIVEKGINLAIAQNLRDLLSVQGFHVIMTREDDRSIHDEGITQIARQKRSDLHNRLAIMEDHPEAIFISIHQNQFPQPSCQGAQIFYSQNRLESQKLAQAIQESFQRNLQPENSRQIKPAQNNLFLLYEAKIPAVMAECGFLSNPQESQKLAETEYQEQVAFTIFDGLMDFLVDSTNTVTK